MKNLELEEKYKLTNDIMDTLDEIPLRDAIEVLANVFMIYGLETMKQELEGQLTAEQVTPELVIETVIDDIKTRGNTIGNSLAMQGLTILEWLDRKEEE